MNRRELLVGVMASTAALALTGCNSYERSNYKMTVEVDTPQGVKTGYAVRRLSKRTPPNVPLPGEDRGSTGVIGQAVAVDLPGGKTLFALLNGADGDYDYSGRNLYMLLEKAREAGLSQPLELWPSPPKAIVHPIIDLMPMFVTFGDVNDPITVEKVEADNLAVSFGESVKLRRIMLEETSEEVTVGIEKRFPWWKKYKTERRRLNGSNSIAVSTNELSDNVGTGEFSRGKNK